MVTRTKKVGSLQELYSTPGLYSSPDMFSPPSERLDHVIRFELTHGCAWGRCTFCGGYNGIKHLVKTSKEYKKHVDHVWQLIGEHSGIANRLTRIFVGGGNALSIEAQTLHELLVYTWDKFKECAHFTPKRLSLYGRTADILRHGADTLEKLRLGGTCRGLLGGTRLHGALSLIYWGVESGADEVLSYVNKGCTFAEMVQAGTMLHQAVIDASVMIMPGLGGMKHYKAHVQRTATLLGEIRPRFITFMGVNAAPHSAYCRRMEQETKEGTNRPLTPKETAEQMTDIIAAMPLFRTKVGCFASHIDAVGLNPVTFGSYQMYDAYEANVITTHLRRAIREGSW